MKELLLKSARLSWVQRFTKRLCWEKTGSSSTLKVAQGKRHGQLSKASVQGSQREPKLHAPIARIWNDQGLTDRLAGGPSRREKPPAHKLIRLQRRPGRPALPHTNLRHQCDCRQRKGCHLNLTPDQLEMYKDVQQVTRSCLVTKQRSFSPGVEVTTDGVKVLALPLNNCATAGN